MADGGVIWEGSPLHQYLQEIGTEHHATPRVHDGLDSEGGMAAVARGAWQHRRRRFPLLLDWRWWFAADTAVLSEAQAAHIARAYAGRLLGSPLICEDDLDTVLAVDSTLAAAVGGGTDALAFPPGDWTGPGLGAATALLSWGAALAAGHWRHAWCRAITATSSRRVAAGVALLVGCVGAGVALRRGCVALNRGALARRHTANLQALEGSLASQRALATVFSRAVRLVQEVELISRGFSVSATAARVGPATRLERDGSDRKCRPLRAAAYRVGLAYLRLLRWHTLVLMKRFPLSSSVDFPGNYFATQPLARLGLPCAAEQDTATDAQLGEDTDGFSLSAIKDLLGCLGAHRSEFLRRLCLVFSAKCLPTHDFDDAPTSLAAEMAFFSADQPPAGKEGHGTAAPGPPAAGPAPSDKDGSEAHADSLGELMFHGGLARMLAGLTCFSDRGAAALEYQTSFQGLLHAKRPEAGPESDGAAGASAGAGGAPLPRPLTHFTSDLHSVGEHLQTALATLHLIHDELRSSLADGAAPTGEATLPAGVDVGRIASLCDRFVTLHSILLNASGRAEATLQTVGTVREAFGLAVAPDAPAELPLGERLELSDSGDIEREQVDVFAAVDAAPTSRAYEGTTRGFGSDREDEEEEGISEEERKARRRRNRQRRKEKRRREKEAADQRRRELHDQRQLFVELRSVLKSLPPDTDTDSAAAGGGGAGDGTDTADGAAASADNTQ